MIVKSFGCSFISGTDLADDGLGKAKAPPSKLSWPSLLAQHFGCEYYCYAKPGSGNLRILESMLNQLKQEDSIFIIGWTWIDRFDYTTTDDVWRSILPNDRDHISEYYYKNLHSQYRDKLTSLIHIKTAIDFLLDYNQKFIMVCQDPLLFETKWHTSPGLIRLQEKIRPYIKDFQGKTFLEWSRDHGFKISDRWHPLEEAHAAAAKYALDHWDDLV